MKKIFFSLFFTLPFLLNAQLIKILKKNIELKMPAKVFVSKITGEDSVPGIRGATVVWHPVQKKYYAAFAGNYLYPFAVFDALGKRISAEDQTCLIDIRGLWYNTKLKKICGNAYNEIGWFRYTTDEKGIPFEYEMYAEGKNQPDAQSIGVFNDKTNMVYFLEGQHIYFYNEDAMQEEDSTIRLYPGVTKTSDINKETDTLELPENYNANVLIYTGIAKAEFGILNIIEKQVELYNKKTGLLTQKLKFPSEVETYPKFNFCYTNGIYWSFNQDTRTWVGYK
jgi:hypothetical protein